MKVFVVGLDGASLELMMPWVESGKLPGFARLIREGGYARLESVPNQRSAAAWTSFQTGKNPGKHGIFEFYERVPETYDITFVNGQMREGRSFFRIASDAGKQVVALNVPMTYPAEPLNGAMISGLDAPGKKSRGVCHPEGLLEELEAREGEYVIEPGLTGCIVNGEIDKAVRLLFEEIESKKRATRFLMEKVPWDLFVTVFRSTDAVHHCFWKYQDPGHPEYRKDEAEKYGDVILRAYQAIDEFVQELLATVDRDTLILVMSDHGCGPKHPASNQLNLLLESLGFLAYESGQGAGGNAVTHTLGKAYRWVVAKTPRRTKEYLWRTFPAFRDRVQSRLCFAGVDWSRTRAFSDTLFPNICINLKGRDPLGIVAPGEEYEQTCREVIEGLKEARDSVSGEPIVDKVMHRRDLYTGPFVERAPDLLVRWREDIPIRGIRMPDRSRHLDAEAMERASKPFIPGEDYRVISGDHQLQGLLLYRNPEGRKNEGPEPLAQASLMDVAPTVLCAMDLPVPRDMDGRVLTEILDREHVGAHPVRYVDADDETPSSSGPSDDKAYTEEDEEKVKERLRSLGYLE